MEVEKLVERARVPVDDERVSIAVRIGATLDRDVVRDRIRPRVALVAVEEVDERRRLRLVHDRVGDPDRAAVPEAGAEVGVQSQVGSDRANERGRSLAHGQAVDGLVPDAASREDRALGRFREGGCLSRGCDDNGRGRGCGEGEPHGVVVGPSGLAVNP
jgi:hypothetical protein